MRGACMHGARLERRHAQAAARCWHVRLPLQVAAAERMAEVWVQLAAELGAGPEQLAQVRVSGGAGAGLLGTAPQP